jgi:hypothetical protein
MSGPYGWGGKPLANRSRQGGALWAVRTMAAANQGATVGPGVMEPLLPALIGPSSIGALIGSPIWTAQLEKWVPLRHRHRSCGWLLTCPTRELVDSLVTGLHCSDALMIIRIPAIDCPALAEPLRQQGSR